MGIPKAATNRANRAAGDSVEVTEPDFTLDESNNESFDEYDASAMLPSGALPDLDDDDLDLPTPVEQPAEVEETANALPDFEDDETADSEDMIVFSEDFDQSEEEFPEFDLDESDDAPSPDSENDELESFESEDDEITEFSEDPEDEEQEPADTLEDFDESDDDTEEPQPEEDEDDDESSISDMAKSALEAIKKGLLSIVAFAGGLLKKLPGVGKLVTNTTRAAIGLALIIAIPVALVFVSAFITRSATAPPEAVAVSLPDQGGVEMSNMALNDDGTELTATLTNTGEVIADITPSATIKATDLKNPISWYVRSDVGECTGETTNLDIEKSVEVTLSCTGSSGSSVKIEGSLE